jgi:RNA polymerase sigma-70 factor (ECF subfamily)
MEELSALSDPQLVVGIARFREPCLAEVYRRHGGAAFGLARRVLGQASLAEDVVQEVFLALWTHPDKFDPTRGTLRSFVLALTHSRAVDAVRSRTAQQRREQREAQWAAAAGYDLEREVWDLAVQDHVAAALATLPDDERRPIELAYFGGHTYRDVAVLLSAPEGTIKSRIRSGLRRLRVALEDSGIAGDGRQPGTVAQDGTAIDEAAAP